MSKSIDFYGPFLKTERAKIHINELENIFAKHIEASKNIFSSNNANFEKQGASVGSNFPKHTPTILGDALHNLRASLDHAYCILVQANGHTAHERSFFPILNNNGRDTWQSRKASLLGHEQAGHGPGQAVIDILSNDIQPFPGGKGEALVDLHALDIADKHKVLLPTQQHTSIQRMKFEGGLEWGGFTIITNGDQNVIPIDIGPGLRLDKQHANAIDFQICFGQGQPLEGKPIISSLWTLRTKVNKTLKHLKQELEKRT